MKTGAEVVGQQALEASLRRAADDLGDMSEPGRKTAAFLSSRGRTDAPRRSGRLAASVHATSSRLEVDVISALAYSNRTHWGYARYGQAPQPWLLEGAQNSEASWLGNYERHADRVLGKVKGA